jgi:hypothetical protein
VSIKRTEVLEKVLAALCEVAAHNRRWSVLHVGPGALREMRSELPYMGRPSEKEMRTPGAMLFGMRLEIDPAMGSGWDIRQEGAV